MHNIIIDIGHGIDTKGKGVPQLKEFDFNQAVAKYIIELAKINNINVILTQPFNSNEVSLSQRTKIINNSNAELCISIHADASASTNARGHWAFYWYDKPNSKRLAEIWRKYADELLSNPSRGIMESKPNSWTNFHMVREVNNMPSILIEHGFMTNKHDLMLLLLDSFRRDCAKVIVKTACEYLGITYKESENVALNINVFGKDITLEKVVMQDNLNYVNLRELFDKLGCKVDWDSETNKTFITLK